MGEIFKRVSLRDIAAALLDLAMPRRCVVCGRHLTLKERHLCLPCLADLPQTYFWTLSRNPMADKFNARIQEDLENDGAAAEPYAFASALFFYNSESPYRRIPWHLKYEGGVESGKFFARMLGDRLAASPQFSDVDLVVPVPLHWTRRFRRGYNQAEVLARAIADSFASRAAAGRPSDPGASTYGEALPPVCLRLLRRVRRTRTQIRVSVEGKSRNVRGAFALSPSALRRLETPLSCGHLPAG